jgi:hypothetical protein
MGLDSFYLHACDALDANSAQSRQRPASAKLGQPSVHHPNGVAGNRLHRTTSTVALKLQFSFTMRSQVHDIVRRLMELAALEERLTTLKRDGETAASVTALIESLRANIPLGVLITHDRMRNRGRRCLAEVHHGVCTGCHLALAVGNVAAVRHGDLHRCGNCGRYLYIVEEEEPAEAASSSTSVRSLPSPRAKSASRKRRS